jgi:hypothetical protein
VARAHILSLTAPAASGQRILIVSGLITPQLVVNIIDKRFPELRSRLPKGGDPSQILPEGISPTGWNTSRSFKIFGKGWSYMGLEESLVDAVNSILELENGWKI